MMMAAGSEDDLAEATKGSSSNGAASSSSGFRVLCKGMASNQAAVVAVAVLGPQGDLVLALHKPVVGFVGGGDGDGEVLLEAMALLEGLHAALVLGITAIEVITDHRMLHNLMLRICSRTGEKLADVMDQTLLAQIKFEQFKISLVQQSQVRYVVKLARDAIGAEIAKTTCAASGSSKEKREACSICLEDTAVSKIHAVEGCAHRFCLSCMKEHVRVKLLDGMIPSCPRYGCSIMLTVEGTKAFLPPLVLDMMVRRIREAHIPLGERVYCPYPKCSALMSLTEVQAGSHSARKPQLRKCVRCGGSLCISCKVAWHEGMTCRQYKRRYPRGGPENAMLEKLAKQRQWQQCERCKHMIERAAGCDHMICRCGYEFCYLCGKGRGYCWCAWRQERRGWCCLPSWW
ncbi:unnamed protein product [Urochloa humidicola]